MKKSATKTLTIVLVGWLFRSYSASRFGDMVPLSMWGKDIKVYLLVHLFSEGVAGERYPVG